MYWIKIINKSSTCVYSYDFNIYEGIMYNHHGIMQEELLYA